MNRTLLLLALSAVGCGSQASTPSPDAGVTTSPLAIVSTSFPREVAGARPFVRDGASFRVAGSALSARIDERAALHLESEDAALSIESNGAAPRIDEKAVVATGGADTSIVFLSSDSSVEELRTLTSASAPTHFTWRLRPGRGISALRLREGRVEALDARGAVRLASAPMFAVDANGKTVALRVALEGETLSADLDTKGLVYPIVVDPAWTATGVVINKRVFVDGIRLDDGRVMALGGYSTATELYDPATGTWTAGPTMTGGPYGMDDTTGQGAGTGLVRFASGKILATAATASLYNQATNSWSAAGTLPGYASVAAPLPGGKRAIAACHYASFSASTSAYIYDETTNAWTSATAMGTARSGCSALALNDGRVLVLGGQNTGGVLSTGEIYNPTTNSWSAIAPMAVARRKPNVAKLSDGRVLAGRGTSWQVYNPSTNSWTAPKTTLSHTEGTLTLLANGRVLLAGGDLQSAAELYNPSTDTWSTAGAMASQRGYHLAVRLTNDRVLIAMGARNYAGVAGWATIGSSELYGDSLGQTCTAGWECASGNCVEGVCCATATCPSGASCSTTAKRGTCVYPLGVPCTSAAQCESGFCVDGYCCNAACGAQCEACDLKDKLGVCWPVLGAPHNSRPACTGPGAGTACGDRCDGADRAVCHVPGPAAACGSDTCVSGVETHSSTCDSGGKCGDVPKSCGAYACGPTTCKTSCATKADCAAGYVCKTGACVAADGLGTACTSAAACSTGFCTDNVCCGVADCGLGRSCGTEKKGTCAKILGVECANDLECGSGHCVDGVCCDTACAGQCEACDVPGKFGQCSPATGAPHGLRAKCDDGAGDACRARTCDGAVDTTTCAGYANGPTVECGSATCDGSAFNSTGTCDGKGACVRSEPRACAPYACDQAGCRAGCTRDDHCAADFVCVTGTCKPSVAKCSEDRLSSVAKDGATTSCAPYRCGPTGECITQCSSSSDCAPGSVCDTASKVCSALGAGGGEDDGGCAMGRSGASATGLLWIAVAMALGSRARKRAV